MSETVTAPPAQASGGEKFSSRNLFILAAIGSAVGLGNIWRFPYIAYENGGGAFIIPYLCALLLAGIPLLFLDYAIGHRYRGSAPLSLRRMSKWFEALGWWQTLVCFIIGIYYAVIVAWAAMYLIFSFTKAWGDDANAFFYGDFLHLSDTVEVGADIVGGVFWPQLIVWLLVLAVLVLGVNKGIARANLVFIPLLLVMFIAMVVQALLLPGATDGLNALFTPNWQALAKPSVWAAAVGQIFFSLSVGFGIMITYSSYLKRKSDLTGSGLVVGFANSSFELLAGIGVFAALGFMAQASGTGVDKVADDGIGLAFIAFPTIISQAPAGEIIGVLFFGSLLFAGITSLISIIEVVIASVRDKLAISRQLASIIVVGVMATVSLLLFPTTTGLYVLDVFDEFINKYGILAGALAMIIAVAWFGRRLPVLSRHLDKLSSFSTGVPWMVMVGGIAPVALAYMLVSDIIAKTEKPYGDYDPQFVGILGWGMVAAVVVLAIVFALLPWSKRAATEFDEDAEDAEVQAIYDARTHGRDTSASHTNVTTSEGLNP